MIKPKRTDVSPCPRAISCPCECAKAQSTHSLLQFSTSAMVPQAAPPLAGCSKILRLLVLVQDLCRMLKGGRPKNSDGKGLGLDWGEAL